MKLCRTMSTNQRVWLDYLALNLMPTTKESYGRGYCPLAIIKRIVKRGGICVISNSFLDVAEFQENQNETEELLKSKKLIIEASMIRNGSESIEECRKQSVFEIIDRICRRPSFWVSCFKELPAANSSEDLFEDAIKSLKNWRAIEKLQTLMEVFAKEPMEWMSSDEFPEEPQNIELKKELNIPPESSVDDVIRVASKLGRLDVYESEYYSRWNKWAAKLHKCDYMLTLDGKLRKV